MFESLQDGLRSAFKTLRGKARLTESNMRDGLALVEQSLLEADVSYQVVQDFMSKVGEKSLGEKVLLALDPIQQLVGIVYEELVSLLGPVDASIPLRGELPIIMLCGLQGSGKTTTCGKLARLLQEEKRRPFLVAADLQRPAAIEQLHVIGRQLGVPVYSEPGATDPVKVCENAVQRARLEDANVVILDTAGRLAIDEELMAQLKRIDNRVQPDQVYFVVDGMTGQDAVNSAQAFNAALELNGLIMTKLDGDARGGALLSVKHVTGVPIKFIGTGEHLDALEPFRPEGMASRILGLGDMVGLYDVARRAVDAEKQQELQDRLRAGEFTLDDFKSQLMTILKPGLFQKMLGMIPGLGGDMSAILEGEGGEGMVRQFAGVIDSMTPEERRNPRMIDASRRARIAKGSGSEPAVITQLIKQFETIGSLLKGISGKSPSAQMQAIRELQTAAMQDPTGQFQRVKKGTGKRLTSDERNRLRKQREKELRKRRRKG